MMANGKKRKVRRKLETIVNREDIISKLPENILHHIISFLPTRCAASTCILSKTWKDLWISTTKLRFTLERKEQITKYTSFIDYVLRRHSSNITSFYLDTANWWSRVATAPKLDLDATLVQSWISTAVNRQVLDVCLLLSSVSVFFTLPLCLCNSNTLTSLKVSTCTLQLPPKIYLPSLKILDLHYVEFSDHFAFNRLFSGLPNIEELKLVFDYWRSSVKNCTISLPTLKRLTLHDYGSYFHLSDCFLKVNVENLLYLNCESRLNLDLNLDNLLSLDEAKIMIWCYEEGERKAHRATNLLAGLSFAKSLKLSQESLADLCRLSSKENRSLFPRFVNLTALHISSEYQIKGCGVTSRSSPSLMDIFHNAPILESLVIQEVRGGTWRRKPYPQCIEFSLKNCTIVWFGGQREILRFVKFVLKAAKGLKCLKLYCTKELCKREKKLQDIMSELNLLPKASNNCVIEFMTT